MQTEVITKSEPDTEAAAPQPEPTNGNVATSGELSRGELAQRMLRNTDDPDIQDNHS